MSDRASRWLWLVAGMSWVGCGGAGLRTSRDGSTASRPTHEDAADLVGDLPFDAPLGSPDSEPDAPAPAQAIDGPVVESATPADASMDGTGTAPEAHEGGSMVDACVPLDCRSTICGHQRCGVTSDGCGGWLDCGTKCGDMWHCERGVCRPSFIVDCLPLTCSVYGSYHYCGPIGDACGGALDCACPKAGWTCENNFCIGRPPVCTPVTCVLFASHFMCGRFDDGCGGTLDCRTCPLAGWTCINGNCKAPPDVCTPRTSCTGPGGESYCGSIGDGCGGVLQCGNNCSSMGLACDSGICGGLGTPPPFAPTPQAPSHRDPPPPPPPRCILPE